MITMEQDRDLPPSSVTSNGEREKKMSEANTETITENWYAQSTPQFWGGEGQ